MLIAQVNLLLPHAPHCCSHDYGKPNARINRARRTVIIKQVSRMKTMLFALRLNELLDGGEEIFSLSNHLKSIDNNIAGSISYLEDKTGLGTQLDESGDF